MENSTTAAAGRWAERNKVDAIKTRTQKPSVSPDKY